MKKFNTSSPFHLIYRYSLANSAYQSLQDNNENQCIVASGESCAGKTEASRMIVHFLTQVSDYKRKPSSLLRRQKSSNSIGSSTKGSNPNSCTSTPKHKSLTTTPTATLERTSCIKFETSSYDSKKSSIKKVSREKTVEFDFSYKKSTENLSGKCSKHGLAEESTSSIGTAAVVKFCPKHNCCNQNLSLDLPIKSKATVHCDNDNVPTTSKNFVQSHRVPNCDLHQQPNQQQTRCKCENLDLIQNVNKSNSVSSVKLKSKLKSPSSNNTGGGSGGTLEENATSSESTSAKVSAIKYKPVFSPATARKYHRSNVDFDSFKSIKKSTKPNKFITQKGIEDAELFRMKDRIGQAEVFLEAMGNAATQLNDNSSRFGKYFDIEFNFRGDPIGGHITHCE